MDAHKALTRVWWNICIIPRGLRVQFFSAWEVSPTFKTKWELKLAQCSKLIINMLLEHDKEILEQTKVQIRSLESQLGQFDLVTVVTPFQTKLRDTIDKYEKEIMNGKKRKFTWDKTDFDQQVAFKWKHTGNTRRGTYSTNQALNNDTSANDVSASDFLSSSDTDDDRTGTP